MGGMRTGRKKGGRKKESGEWGGASRGAVTGTLGGVGRTRTMSGDEDEDEDEDEERGAGSGERV